VAFTAWWALVHKHNGPYFPLPAIPESVLI
jgi:hypothetical protein